MFLRTLLGVLTIVAATSCVPQPSSPLAPPRRQVVHDPKQLLRKLDLAVPDDVARLAGEPETVVDLFARARAAPAFLANLSTEDRARASDCLATAIYYEARSEPLDGQRAVAQVVLNRVRDLAFPNTVCGVVYQGHERRTGCQFSFTCDGSMLRGRRDPRSWEQARAVAEAALDGYVFAPVGSATHYHANYMVPWWAPSLSRIGEFGSQIFYRWPTGMERALAFRQRYSGAEPVIDAAQPGFAPTVAGGVTVHYGGQSAEESVIVHRDAAQDAGVEPVAHLTTSGGVRIHRNVDAPTGGDDAPAAETSEL